jgi:hypothetical protein
MDLQKKDDQKPLKKTKSVQFVDEISDDDEPKKEVDVRLFDLFVS